MNTEKVCQDNMRNSLQILPDGSPKLNETLDEAIHGNCPSVFETENGEESSVGPFFIINGRMLMAACPLFAARKQADKLDYSLSHEDLFDSCELSDEYFDYPRGRVIWDTTNQRGIIYIDPCIKDRGKEVASCYHLKQYTVEEDEHYHCKCCTKFI